jgi:hypothetical protein
VNIFILDNDIEKSVQYHIDRHVVKMPLEAAQMISTALAVDHYLGYLPRATSREETAKLKASISAGWPFYKPSYINNPCTIWARQSNANFTYLVEYCLLLNKEKLHRYPGKPAHKSALLIEEFVWDWWPTHLPSYPDATPFVQAMPEEYKSNDAIESYRTYYRIDKVYDKSGNYMANWTKREIPEWW